MNKNKATTLKPSATATPTAKGYAYWRPRDGAFAVVVGSYEEGWRYRAYDASGERITSGETLTYPCEARCAGVDALQELDYVLDQTDPNGVFGMQVTEIRIEQAMALLDARDDLVLYGPASRV